MSNTSANMHQNSNANLMHNNNLDIISENSLVMQKESLSATMQSIVAANTMTTTKNLNLH
jgi:hypothetical protein